MVKKYFYVLLILYFLCLPLPVIAADDDAAATTFSLQDAVNSLDLSVLEEYKDSVDGEISYYMEGKSIKDLLFDFVQGKWEFDIKELGSNLAGFLFKEVAANSGLLGKLLILSVLAALLLNLQSTFSSGIAQISYLACFMALAAIAMGSFRVVLELGQHTIENMVTFMMAMLPQMLLLTAGLGNIHTSAILFPILMTVATAFANAVKNIVFPLIIMSAVLNLINNMSSSLKVEKLSKFCGQMAQLSLGFFLSVFVGFITLRALYASVLDKVALRTTKFVTDNAIPVVGKMFSDSVEVAAGYVVMIKQALGVMGVIIVFGIIIFPLLKVAALALIYKITAAVVEPLGDAKTAAVLDIMSSHLFLMLAAVASVGLMFFIMIAIVAGMSNGLGALR
ncbi:MAG: stage III sporulation protein AE [Syntrophomonadaceae bacterium]|nr:stage III sporulation protein AE [Syntrophomonadaceae bacterium]MDD3024559.1 stage III sporulation protein AE [Syntrophomonadaceae bacterium]